MKSKHSNFELRSKTQLFADHLFIGRTGEERMGDFLKSPQKEPRVVVLGISEAVGPFANYGRTGSEFAFSAFFRHFLNWPHHGQSVDIAGNIAFVGTFPADVESASLLVEELDAFVFDVLMSFVSPTQIPIIIGGGHNNALPLMRWANQVKGCSTVLNIDAHTDCRAITRRHSGNSFSFAIAEGILSAYHVFGVHAYGINSFMRDFIKTHQVDVRFFESYLTGDHSLAADIRHVFLKATEPLGLEIDMDCIANMPSSASSPSGWRLDDIRKVVLSLNGNQYAYVHLTEGAITQSEHERTIGRALSYLCLDAIASMESL